MNSSRSPRENCAQEVCSTHEFFLVAKSLQTIHQQLSAIRSRIDSELKSDNLKVMLHEIIDNLDDVPELMENVNKVAAKAGDKCNLFNDTSMYTEMHETKMHISEISKELDKFRTDIATTLHLPSFNFSCVSGQEFLIEVKNSHVKLVPSDWMLVAATKQVKRYRSPSVQDKLNELNKNREILLINAEKAWTEFLRTFNKDYMKYKKVIHDIANLDCLYSLADLAYQHNYCRPEFSEENDSKIEIVDGRNPIIVESIKDGLDYVINSTNLSKPLDVISELATYGEKDFPAIGRRFSSETADTLREQGATWHRSCYASTTNKAVLDRAKALTNKYLGKHDGAHYQAMIWYNDIVANPKPSSPQSYGWNLVDGTFKEVMTPLPPAPEGITQLLNEVRCQIISGPNMGGKSSYIRQVAIICLMAHMGSYVPAQSVKLSILDGIFTRMGASDNMYENRSTFMTELLQTSDIMQKATPKSLVIIDELGRGTSTHDGAALAYASSQKRKVPENGDISRKTATCCAEQVAAILDSDDEETLGFDEDYPSDELKTDSNDNVDNDNDSESDSDNENPVDRLPIKCFVLFVTHYPLVTELEAKVNDHCKNFHMDYVLSEDAEESDLTFLYKMVDGPTSSSYGFNVAKLAGIPSPIIKNAKSISSSIHHSSVSHRHIYSKLYSLFPFDHVKRILAMPGQPLGDRTVIQVWEEISSLCSLLVPNANDTTTTELDLKEGNLVAMFPWPRPYSLTRCCYHNNGKNHKEG
ncbi:DNA mismatch repair protein Msh3 [Nymphon striatum]|nr:DNA mismatch repair protein Msh3 [Nymphon striatum]